MTDTEQLEKIKEILRSLDITMSVDACSCCAGAHVYFKYKNFETHTASNYMGNELSDASFDTRESNENNTL